MVLIFGCSNTSKAKKYKIGFSQCISDHPWRESMNHSMQVQASLSPEFELKIFEANNNLELQIEQIRTMISGNYDVIIVSPMLSDKLVPVISEAFDKGIPVILIDRKINSEKYTTYVGADNLEVGRNAGNFIASASKTTTNVIELKVGDNASPSVERSKGFYEVVDSLTNIRVVASIDYTTPKEHEKILSRVLDSLKNVRVDYFYAFNDLLAFESWQIARKKGIDNINFIGVDGLNIENGGIDLVRKGILKASILYPTGGSEAIKLAERIVKGEKISKSNLLTTTVIDIHNADIMKNQFDKIDETQNNIEKQQERIKQQEKTYSTQSNILKLVLGLLITSVLLASYIIYSSNKLRKKKRELELRNQKITIQRNQIKKIAEEVKISNEARVNFFTGLSHEFKTPITLILSSTESLTENKVIRDNKLLNEVGLIYNNSKRLLRLINQLLDFRKIEDRKFILKASKTNLYQFSKLIFKDFEREAQKRNISFTINTNNPDLFIFLDRNLMDKVYFNLLSNAFKFTPNNGAISIDIIDEAESNFVKIHFKDSGIGIPKKEMDNVFQAFFQGSNNNKASSGIGLHLSKEFIEMHKGTIEVNSKHGTEFIITLYKDNVHLNSDEIVYEPDIIDSSIIHSNLEYEDDAFGEQLVLNDNEHYSVLIIEDNPDLIKYLKGKLSSEYSVHVSDGTDGIEKAIEIIPDIILCDISLPDKSGFEICEILKKDLRTSHIPTIILTALNNKESYIKSLEVGADLFLTKPFSFAILSQSIKTLIYNREKLRYYFVNNVHTLDDISNFGSLEQEFISKVNKIIHDNIDNSKFSVENLANNLNISRIQLYRKMKAIIGVNVSDYIQNIRLEKAKYLLQETQLTISEIAYATGFSSPNYFSTSFKVKFKKSPKEFREE
ncbi:substrate-binding domain-containing protein [Mariniflexile sp. HNIBRBA6329]|uniref:substrate-binding domain-containing protein n=1 Tax=Mariniflexile sp. HNIBRBA6329 TaxID=3373088 RepID=UPI0037475EB3